MEADQFSKNISYCCSKIRVWGEKQVDIIERVVLWDDIVKRAHDQL